MDNDYTHSKTSEAQQFLDAALRYWLYQSYIDSSFRDALHGRKHISVRPLAKCASALLNLGLALPNLLPESPNQRVAIDDYARKLSFFYRKWEQCQPQFDVKPNIIPKAKKYQDWLLAGGKDAYYWPIHSLRSYLLKRGADFFESAVVHGSIATLDDTIGFSDMDLAFIVRASVLKEPDMLLQLRKVAADILAFAYAFDPFMHHGPYYLSEIDLAYYPESVFPSILFGYAVDLLDNSREIPISSHLAHVKSDKMLQFFADTFRGRGEDVPFVKDSYDIEWMLGSVMFLPALYIQRVRGQFFYKRDTFILAKNDFTSEEWMPIQTATELRSQLGPRPKPSRFYVKLARMIQFPNLLQKRARNHPLSVKRAKNVQKHVDEIFMQNVLKLIDNMQKKIAASDKHKRTSAEERNDVKVFPSSLKLFYDISRGPFVEFPQQMEMDQYDAAIDYLVSYWQKLLVKPTAIYQIGQVGVPGISDLDLVLVYPDDVFLDYNHFQPQIHPSWVQDVLLHSPYICPESAWINLPLWYPTFHLHFLWGKKLQYPIIDEGAAPGSAFGNLVDYLLVKIPRVILWLAWRRPVRLRTLLCVLHGMNYTFELAERAGIQNKSDFKIITDRFSSLRSNWFGQDEEKRYKQLEELISQLLDLAVNLISVVDQTLLSELESEAPLCREKDRHAASIFYFQSPWSFIDAIQFAYESRWVSFMPIWVSPGSFEMVLSYYASIMPRFGGYLFEQGCRTDLKWDGGCWRFGLKQHVRAMVKYAETSFKMGVPPQLYLALGYKPS